jgi:hypothetical protein
MFQLIENLSNKLLQKLFLILCLLLPINNLIIQTSTKIFGFSEYVALWKDVIVFPVLFILSLNIVLILVELLSGKDFYQKHKKNIWLALLPIILVIMLNIWTIITSFFINQVELRAFVFGYYFELWWLNLFGLLVSWWHLSEIKYKYLTTESHAFFTEWKNFFKQLTVAIVAGFVPVILITSLSWILGQDKVLSVFGYGVTSSSDNLIGTSLTCHKIDYQVEGCRSSGTFTHPLHFSSYLLIILPVFLILTYYIKKFSKRIIFISLVFLTLLFIFLSVSRFALLGLSVSFASIILYYAHQNKIIKLLLAKVFLSIVILISVFGGLLVLNINPEEVSKILPEAIVKPSSTTWHYRHIRSAIDTIDAIDGQAWYGLGLGVSGSAARPKYQDLEKNIIYRDYGYIAYKWGFLPPDFLLPDNWFLQTILNGGYIYTLIYFLVILIPMFGIYKFYKSSVWADSIQFELIASIAFLSIFIGNLLQHLWESQTLVIFWSLIYFWYLLSKKYLKHDKVP